MPERVAQGIVEEYVNFYADYSLGGVSVDQSALKVDQIDELKNRVDALAKALSTELDDTDTSKSICKALVLAHWEAQSYNGEMFVDLADFCDCLKEHYPSGNIYLGVTISDLCSDVSDFIKSKYFVLRSCYSGPSYQYSYGTSIYFPWSRIAPDYKQLKFVKAPTDYAASGDGSVSLDVFGWAKFLETYISKTRRDPRNVSTNSALASFNSSFAPQRFRKTIDMGPGNLVVSMRNPPLVALPDECIRAEASIKSLMLEEVKADDKKTCKKAEGEKPSV